MSTNRLCAANGTTTTANLHHTGSGALQSKFPLHGTIAYGQFVHSHPKDPVHNLRVICTNSTRPGSLLVILKSGIPAVVVFSLPLEGPRNCNQADNQSVVESGHSRKKQSDNHSEIVKVQGCH